MKYCYICGQNEGIKSSYTENKIYHEFYACQQCRDLVFFHTPIQEIIKYWNNQ